MFFCFFLDQPINFYLCSVKSPPEVSQVLTRESQQISCIIGSIQWTGFIYLTLGVINLSEAESYFMGTESYEGQPVCDTLLK